MSTNRMKEMKKKKRTTKISMENYKHEIYCACDYVVSIFQFNIKLATQTTQYASVLLKWEKKIVEFQYANLTVNISHSYRCSGIFFGLKLQPSSNVIYTLFFWKRKSERARERKNVWRLICVALLNGKWPFQCS